MTFYYMAYNITDTDGSRHAIIEVDSGASSADVWNRVRSIVGPTDANTRLVFLGNRLNVHHRVRTQPHSLAVEDATATITAHDGLNLIMAIKCTRDVFGVGLREAKEFIDYFRMASPAPVHRKIADADCMRLREAGFSVYYCGPIVVDSPVNFAVKPKPGDELPDQASLIQLPPEA